MTPGAEKDKREEVEEEELLEEYSLRGGSQTIALFSRWGEWEYRLPDAMGEMFLRLVPEREARVLDAGAGSGSGGEFLLRAGYTRIYALDSSAVLLEQVQKKGIYKELYLMVLGEKLALPDYYFDAVVSTGVMGLAPPGSFDELIRITRPGGQLIFTVGLTHYLREGFREKQAALEREGKWKLRERTALTPAAPGYDPSTLCYVFAYQV